MVATIGMGWFGRRKTAAPAPRGRPFPTRDPALWVRSDPERRIADWLLKRGIPFSYEPDIDGKRPDFRIERTRVLVEYWGGAGFARYGARMAEKVEAFEAAGWHVISLLPIHLRVLEFELERALREAGVDVAPKQG